MPKEYLHTKENAADSSLDHENHEEKPESVPLREQDPSNLQHELDGMVDIDHYREELAAKMGVSPSVSEKLQAKITEHQKKLESLKKALPLLVSSAALSGPALAAHPNNFDAIDDLQTTEIVSSQTSLKSRSLEESGRKRELQADGDTLSTYRNYELSQLPNINSTLEGDPQYLKREDRSDGDRALLRDIAYLRNGMQNNHTSARATLDALQRMADLHGTESVSTFLDALDDVNKISDTDTRKETLQWIGQLMANGNSATINQDLWKMNDLIADGYAQKYQDLSAKLKAKNFKKSLGILSPEKIDFLLDHPKELAAFAEIERLPDGTSQRARAAHIYYEKLKPSEYLRQVQNLDDK